MWVSEGGIRHRGGRHLRRASAVVLMFVSIGADAGCAGEAVVSFKGTVTRSSQAGYSFDGAPNPGALPPLANATVVLAVDPVDKKGLCSEPGVRVRADGSFAIDRVFGASIVGPGHATAVICFSAPGFQKQQLEFSAPSNKADGSRYLNVRLQKAP